MRCKGLNQKGSVLVLFSLLLPILLGVTALVVDAGYGYLEKTKLQNSADAIVLAGVRELPASTSNAITVGYQYAAKNDVTSGEAAITCPDSNTIQAILTRTEPTFFSKIFNVNSYVVQAKAKAKVSTLVGGTGCMPFGIQEQKFLYRQQYILKYGGGAGSTGNYGALQLGPKPGADALRDIIVAGGYKGEIKIGDYVTTEPGNMSGPVKTSINDRIALDPSATFDTVQVGSPRLILVPIITGDPQGRSDVLVVGFGLFFMEAIEGNGSNCVLKGEFVQRIYPGTGGTATNNYGVYTVALVE